MDTVVKRPWHGLSFSARQDVNRRQQLCNTFRPSGRQLGGATIATHRAEDAVSNRALRLVGVSGIL